MTPLTAEKRTQRAVYVTPAFLSKLYKVATYCYTINTSTQTPYGARAAVDLYSTVLIVAYGIQHGSVATVETSLLSHVRAQPTAECDLRSYANNQTGVRKSSTI